MASIAILKKLFNLDFPRLHIEDITFTMDEQQRQCINIFVHLNDSRAVFCPVCEKLGKKGRRCATYDHRGEINSSPEEREKTYRKWRGCIVSDGGTIVNIYSPTRRIMCKTHKVLTAHVPWANGKSYFTQQFEKLVAMLSFNISENFTGLMVGMKWSSVDSIVKRVPVEQDRNKRYANLTNIIVDEMCTHNVQKYATIVTNQDTNEIIWSLVGHDIDTLSAFFEELTEEQRASIKTVVGGGAKWIDDCVAKFVPHAQRCVDNFHDMFWIKDVIEHLRRSNWKLATID